MILWKYYRLEKITLPATHQLKVKPTDYKYNTSATTIYAIIKINHEISRRWGLLEDKNPMGRCINKRKDLDIQSP